MLYHIFHVSEIYSICRLNNSVPVMQRLKVNVSDAFARARDTLSTTKYVSNFQNCEAFIVEIKQLLKRGSCEFRRCAVR